MPEKRVGSYTLGVSLILFGILYLFRTFTGLIDYEMIIKLWPVVLIMFGIELLLTNFGKTRYKYKIDFLSLLVTFCILAVSMCMAGIEFVMENFPQYINM